MRLIDADRLTDREIAKYLKPQYKDCADDIRMLIDDQPTVSKEALNPPMNTLNFLRTTTKIAVCGGITFQYARPLLKCEDGFSMSVQAARGMCCVPSDNVSNGVYKKVEVRCPSEIEEELIQYAKDISHLTNTVYCYVPVEVIERIVEKHGGIVYEQ